MSYKIELTTAERDHLAWLTRRGYFPELTFNEMVLTKGHGNLSTGESSLTYEIPEHAAWAITQAREEDTHGEWLFACTAEPLLGKLLALEASIV